MLQPKRALENAMPRAGMVLVILCLALLALLSVIQVAHIHQFGTDADHCPICIVVHSIAPPSVAAVAIILVQLGFSSPAVGAVRVARRPIFSHFTRPPPVSF